MADYSQNADQKGDVLHYLEDDTGKILVENGFTIMTSGFETMALYALLGGNDEDDKSESTEHLQWWGNEGEPEDRQLRTRTQPLLYGTPLNSANIEILENATKADLEDTFVFGGYADAVTVSVRLTGPKTVEFKINLLINGDVIPLTLMVNQ